MDTTISKVRNLLNDNLITTARDIFDYETSTSSKIFTLSNSNAVSSSIIVYKNGVLWANTNYSYSSSTGKLTVTGSLSMGDSLEVDYSYYEKYSDTELKNWIRASFGYLSIERYKTFVAKSDDIIFPTPTEQEEWLISIITNILIVGSISRYTTPELSVIFNETDSKETKITKVINNFEKSKGFIGYIDTKRILNIEEEI